MTSKLFGFNFDETEICTIDKINYNHDSHIGTCKLISNTNTYVMSWEIIDFPMESSGMPGSPYPIKVSYNIGYKSNGTNDDSLQSLSGQFIYEINSGTFPNLSLIGIRYGQYYTCSSNNKNGQINNILFNISENEPYLVYLFS